MELMISLAVVKAIVYNTILVIIGIMAIAVLVKAFMFLRRLDKIVEYNTENINSLMVVLPETIESVNDGVQSVTTTVDSANEAIDLVKDTFTLKTRSFSDMDTILEVVRVVGEVIKGIMGYFKK